MMPKICIFPLGLITSGFVNGKITSSLALAGGESSRLIQYLRKLHCRAQEAGGRNRLPVSVSAAGDNLCRHRLASVELAAKTSPSPWQLGNDGIFSLPPWFGIPRWLLGAALCAGLPAGVQLWGGMGSFHGHPTAFPALPQLLEGEWDLLAPGTAPARFWVLEVGPAVRGIHSILLLKHGQVWGLCHTAAMELHDWSHVALPQGQKLRPHCYSWLCPGRAMLAPAGAASIPRKTSG